MTPATLRDGLRLLATMRSAAIRERRRDLLPAIEALESAALKSLVADTVPGDFRPTLYAPAYARTELATQLMMVRP